MSNATDQGILTFAYGADYQKQAYCQALTARQSLGLPLTAVVDQLEYPPLAEVANVVIDAQRYAKFEYEKNALALTPYRITFKTDADMLFPAGSSVYHAEGLPFSSGVATDVLNNVSHSTAYREVECGLGLPTVYSALFSFDREAPEAQEFFAHIGYMLKHWYTMRIWDHTDKRLPPTTDTLYSMAHLHTVGASRLDGNQFVHCKPFINRWTHEQWTNIKKLTIDNKCRMYLDGLRIGAPFHYFDKALIDDKFIERLNHVCSLQAQH